MCFYHGLLACCPLSDGWCFSCQICVSKGTSHKSVTLTNASIAYCTNSSFLLWWLTDICFGLICSHRHIAWIGTLWFDSLTYHRDTTTLDRLWNLRPRVLCLMQAVAGCKFFCVWGRLLYHYSTSTITQSCKLVQVVKKIWYMQYIFDLTVSKLV